MLFLMAGGVLYAQIGQYPGGGYPPGGYPPGGGYPGQYPGGGGTGIPWPRKGKKGTSQDKDKNAEPMTKASGKLSKLEDKVIEVELPDGRVMHFQRDDKLKVFKESKEIQASQLKVGDEVTVEGTEDKEGNLLAKNVNLDKSAPAAEAGKSAEAGKPAEGAKQEEEADARPATVDAPAPSRDPNDPGPPTLKRGGKPRAASAEADAEDPPSAPPTSQRAASVKPELAEQRQEQDERRPIDPTIAKAREAAENFSEGLPNYVCKEFMARYQSTVRPVDWRPLDVVSTEVVYLSGKETYRNVAVNGKPIHKAIEEVGGAWSTGEFGTMLRDLFSPSTAAEFYPLRESMSGGISAKVFSFRVERLHSHWHVQVPSQSINPAYKGSVWIDPKTGRVLRIEMQARALPEEFPLVSIESAIDYENVRLGSGEYLLPVHAENLSCVRGSTDCSRNAIDFRNYHKYEADSSITFTTQN